MTTSTRERRDWTLLIFIIPIGVILMLIAGQIAIRLVPIWSVNAGMQSKLDPNNLPKQQSGLVQPILPAILTPLGWLDTFLTPGADSGNQNIVFPPFVVFEPSATPAVTSPLPTVPTVATTPPPTIPVTKPPTVVVTQPPNNTGTPPPPTGGGGGGTTVPPTSVPTTSTPIPTATGTPSIAPGLPVAVPPEININLPPDGTVANLPPGTYTIVDLRANGGNPLVVSSIPNGKYELIYYESLDPADGTQIRMDQVIVGVSNATDGSYYEVFNWGDGIADTNTNVNFTTLPADPACTAPNQECDNRVIPTANLYPGTSGPAPSTGILIDVDTAHGAPPPNTYNYLVIISPLSPDAAQIDAIVQPVPQISGAAAVPVSKAADAPAPAATAAPVSPAATAPAPAATTAPVAPAATTAPVAPADVAPAPANVAPVAPANAAPVSPADVAPAPADAAPVSADAVSAPAATP